MPRGNRSAFRRSARRVIRRTGEPVTLVRQTAGKMVRGKLKPGEPTTESRQATVLPLRSGSMAGGDARSALPDGARLDQGRLFLIHVLPGQQLEALRTVEDISGPDIVRYKGVDYTVQNVEDFAEFGHIEVTGLGPSRVRA